MEIQRSAVPFLCPWLLSFFLWELLEPLAPTRELLRALVSFCVRFVGSLVYREMLGLYTLAAYCGRSDKIEGGHADLLIEVLAIPCHRLRCSSLLSSCALLLGSFVVWANWRKRVPN